MLQRVILDQFDFRPAVIQNLKMMDRRIFVIGRMDIRADLFGSLNHRLTLFHEDDQIVLLERFGITI
jgi:hypothetical protein